MTFTIVFTLTSCQEFWFGGGGVDKGNTISRRGTIFVSSDWWSLYIYILMAHMVTYYCAWEGGGGGPGDQQYVNWSNSERYIWLIRRSLMIILPHIDISRLWVSNMREQSLLK